MKSEKGKNICKEKEEIGESGMIRKTNKRKKKENGNEKHAGVWEKTEETAN